MGSRNKEQLQRSRVDVTGTLGDTQQQTRPCRLDCKVFTLGKIIFYAGRDKVDKAQ